MMVEPPGGTDKSTEEPMPMVTGVSRQGDTKLEPKLPGSAANFLEKYGEMESGRKVATAECLKIWPFLL